MSGYINFKRDFFKSDLYRKSSCGQREVFLALVIRVNYESQIIDFGGKRRVLDLGQIWFSRRGLLEELRYSGVKDSTIRNGVKKLVQKGFLSLVISSRTGGSIYQCTAKFYNEISEPFDLKKAQILRPTNDQRTTNKVTNERPTNDQQKTLTVNELEVVATNERPTNDQQTTNKRPTNSLITLNNSITKELNKGKEEPKIEIDFKNLNETQKAVPAFSFIENYKKEFPLYAVDFEKDIQAAKKICKRLKDILRDKKKADGQTNFQVKNHEIIGFGAKFCEKLHLSDFYKGSELTTLERNFNSAYAEIRRKYAKIKPIKTKYHPIMGEIPVNPSKNRYGKISN